MPNLKEKEYKKLEILIMLEKWKRVLECKGTCSCT